MGFTLGEIREEAWSRGDVGTALGTTALENLVMLGFAEESEPVARDWLVPGFGGLYYTPNEPVDPRDCDRWPDSPYCGGTGITSDFGNLGTGLGIDISISNCEQCITVNQSLAFIALPPYTVCHRFDNGSCRPPAIPPPPAPSDPDIPGLPPLQNAYEIEGYCRLVIAHSVKASRSVAVGAEGVIEGSVGLAFGGTMPPQRWATDQQLRSNRWYRAALRNNEQFQITYYCVSSHSAGGHILVTQSRAEADALERESPGDRWVTACGGTRIENECAYRDYPYNFRLPGTQTLLRDASISAVRASIERNNQAWGIRFSGTGLLQPVPWGLINSPCHSASHPPQPGGVPPMPCSCEDNEEMLRAIYNRLGVEDYPVELPASLFDNSDEEIEVESNAQYLTWLVQQMDGLVGQFPIELEIEDIDPIEEGNQKKRITLPNLAETLADMYALAIKNGVDSSVHTEFLTRLTAEMISTKIAALITQDYAKANADFLGYEGNPVSREAVFNFDPDPERLDNLNKLFRTVRKRFKGWRNDSRETVLDYLQKNQFINGIFEGGLFQGR